MKATKQELNARYLPALIELSKQESITGKIAYACGRSIAACDNALKDIEKSRTMILESRALKEEDGKTIKIVPVLKEEGKTEDGKPKMVPVLGLDGKPKLEYEFGTIEKRSEALTVVFELEKNEVDVPIHQISASEIMSLKNIKDGGVLIYNLGDIIDHEK